MAHLNSYEIEFEGETVTGYVAEIAVGGFVVNCSTYRGSPEASDAETRTVVVSGRAFGNRAVALREWAIKKAAQQFNGLVAEAA